MSIQRHGTKRPLNLPPWVERKKRNAMKPTKNEIAEREDALANLRAVLKYAAIQGALSELVSAESSLNMYPDTSTVDGNAKHALVHMHAAFRLMNMAHHNVREGFTPEES